MKFYAAFIWSEMRDGRPYRQTRSCSGSDHFVYYAAPTIMDDIVIPCYPTFIDAIRDGWRVERDEHRTRFYCPHCASNDVPEPQPVITSQAQLENKNDDDADNRDKLPRLWLQD